MSGYLPVSREHIAANPGIFNSSHDGVSIRLTMLTLVASALLAGCGSSSSEPSAQTSENPVVENQLSVITSVVPATPESDDPSGQTVETESGPVVDQPEEEKPEEELSTAIPLPLPVQATLAVVPDKTFRIDWQPVAGADFYRVLENPDGVSGYTAISEDLSASLQTFDHRVALYSRLNARYMVQACNLRGCTDSPELPVPDSLDQAVVYFKADNSADQNRFGSTVAHSGDGNTLAVKANNDVYVFARSDGLWMQQAHLESDGRGFRGAIDLSQDGNTLAVGAASYDAVGTDVGGGRLDSSGAAFIFKRNDGVWQQDSFVNASNVGESDSFGRSLSLSADGNFLAVGATGEDSDSTGVNGDQNDSGRNHGAAYVFVREDGNWRQEAFLKSTRNGRDFGWSIDLSERGDTLVIGEASAVNVFVRAPGGWQPQFFQESQGGGLFSVSVSLNGDGSLLAIGSPSNSLPENSFTRTGTVFVYERSNAAWKLQATVQASNPPFSNSGVIKVGDRFGESVSLSANGKTMAVGAPYEESAATGFNGDQFDDSLYRAGAAYVFNQGDGAWVEKAYVKSVNSHALQAFGGSVSLNANGESLAIGAPREHSEANGINGDRRGYSNPDSGAVFLY